MEKEIFLLEDEDSIAELVACSLALAGLRVKRFATCAEFLSVIFSANASLVILDIMLPDGNGLDVLKKVRAHFPKLPVIIMSALGQETDKVKGLNLGADDYISKPFGVLEFSARVTSLLRRTNTLTADGEKETELISISSVTLCPQTMKVTLRGAKLELNAKEFSLLHYLMLNAGIVLSREKLLTEVWGYDYAGETRTVDNHIARLRKAGLEDYIITVFGSGYKFLSVS